MLHITVESDLKPLSNQNIIFKHADDTNLLVPEHTNVQLLAEFDAIKGWAAKNMMIINLTKTNELIFHRSNPQMVLDIIPLPGIDIVN
jgi:hypothetical protein